VQVRSDAAPAPRGPPTLPHPPPRLLSAVAGGGENETGRSGARGGCFRAARWPWGRGAVSEQSGGQCRRWARLSGAL
jgi:hypothetical protein